MKGRSAFGVRRSAFDVRRLAFGVWRSAVGVWRSAFGVRRSAFGGRVRRSVFLLVLKPGISSEAGFTLDAEMIVRFLLWSAVEH